MVVPGHYAGDRSVGEYSTGGANGNAMKLRRLLDEVNSSMFPVEARLSSIAECLYEFDHRSKVQHDLELQEGAANVLFQKLALAVAVCHGKQGRGSKTAGLTESSELDHEIAMVSTALEMVYRASDIAIEASFEEIGREVLPLLVRVVERAYDSAEMSVRLGLGLPAISKDRKIAVQKATKVLAAFSLVPCAKVTLAHQKGLLTALVKVVDTSTKVAPLLMTEAARFNAIAAITNLAFAEQNRMTMMAHPGLVLAVSMSANSASSEMARQCAALAIINLSHGDDDLPAMAGNEYLLDSLVNLMNDDNPETRQNAAVALYNLASSEENKANNVLDKYGDEVVLDTLSQVISQDDSLFWNRDNARAEAAETLFNMSCSTDPQTTHKMAHHPTLLNSLATALNTSQTHLDLHLYCAATLRRMAELVRAPMPQHPVLLTALVHAATWTKTDCIAQALEIQSANPDHQAVMVRHAGMLDALSNLALAQGADSAKVRAAALSAIENLSSRRESRGVMANNEGIMLALTRASYNHGDTEEERLDGETLQKVKQSLKYLVDAM